MKSILPLIITFLLASLPVQASETQIGDWFYGETPEGGFVAYTKSENDEKFGLICKHSRDCNYFVMSIDVDCPEGSSLPLIVNTNIGWLGTPAQCYRWLIGQALELDEFALIDNLVRQSQKGGLALVAPLEGGDYIVARFSLDGASEALSRLDKYWD